MKIYKSKVTGTILRTESAIHSEYWEEVKPVEPKKAKKKEK